VLVVLCTFLLAAGVLLVVGVTGWAQDQPTGTTTQQPTGTTAQPPAQPAQQQKKDEMVIDFWEPQVGTRAVYYVNDVNDIHGNVFGTATLGYVDDYILWANESPPLPINFSGSYYKSVEAISDMNPVYFDLAGPWYFNMTTPYKVVEEVIGIQEAPDAAQFPEATHAIRTLVIGSGGVRFSSIGYNSNNVDKKEWYEWGYTTEWFPPGSTTSRKDTVHYRSPSNRKLNAPIVTTFPLTVGSTGSQSAVYEEGGMANENSKSGTYEVVAEGKITVPGGIYDALLLKYNLTYPSNGKSCTEIAYQWMAKDVGMVARVRSLPNELGPTFNESTENYILESFTPPGGAGQHK